MRKLALVLFVLAWLALPNGIYAQGCMEADSDEEGMQMAGFFQPQFGYLFGEEEDAYSFSLKRARIAMFGNIPYDISYYLCLEMSQFILIENTGVLDAFISYTRLGPYAKLTLGQYKAPFSLEQNTPCSGLHTIKRAKVVDNLAAPQRDIGLMISGSYEDLVIYNLAFMNGTGIATKDDNKAKDIVARVVVSPIKGLSVGGSYRFGKHFPLAEGVEEEDERTRYGGELELDCSDLLVQAEYITGEDVGSTIKGGGCEGTQVVEGSFKKAGMYVQALYMTPWNLQPVIKYESFDPDTDQDGDQIQITTFGFNYFVNDWTRVQLNYLYCAEQDGYEISNDEMLMQVQVKF